MSARGDRREIRLRVRAERRVVTALSRRLATCADGPSAQIVRTRNSMMANLSVVLVAPLALLALASCSSEDAQWSPEKRLSEAQRPTDFGLGHLDRFGLRDTRMPAAQGQQPASASAFSATTPGGWSTAAASEFRQLNWRVDADPEAECYLTAGNLRGGKLANVNRWFGQFGKPPITQAEFDALPRHDLLGQSATIVTIHGEFRGMGGNGKPGHMLLGLVGGTDEDMVTLKFVAKKATVETERERFLQLGSSIRRGAGSKASGGSAAQDPPANAANAKGAATFGDGYVAHAPSHWAAQASSAFRQLNWTIGTSGAECYLTAGNLRGGKLANVNRWVSAQFGQTPLDAAQFAALETSTLLGSPAALVSLRGEFKGMDGAAKSDFALLGLVGGTDEDMVTLKFVGPASVVEQERAAFLAVAASIRRAGEPAPAAVTKPAATPTPTAADAPSAPFAGAVPAAWQAMGDTGSRLLRHRFGQTGECYVGQLGGELAQMLSVWCGEMSQPAPDSATIAALPKQAMLGGEGVLLDLRGEHRGTGGQPKPGMRLLVAVKSEGQGVVFCKMLGSEGEVEQERANFAAFCQSLERNDG